MSGEPSASLTDAVDWPLAARAGAVLAPAGPTAGPVELREHVEALRASAHRAVPHVADVTRMAFTDGAGPARVLVVDRAGWVRANARSMQTLLQSVPTGRAGHGPATRDDDDPVAAVVGGLEIGGTLAMLSTKVLGQLEPFGDEPTLLLVAPNVLRVQRQLGLDADDFRLWVCLHEQTHALQFGAAPWLVDHLRSRVGALLGEVAGTAVAVGEGSALARTRAAADLVRRFVRQPPGTPLAERLLTAGQREQMAQVAAVMSLLEGHADVMMDVVGPRVVPSVRAIRKAFDARRASPRGTDVVLRKVLGMDAKIAQYVDGAAFVRGVRRRAGTTALNVVWDGPQNLPTPREISDPAAWLRRVHG